MYSNGPIKFAGEEIIPRPGSLGPVLVVYFVVSLIPIFCFCTRNMRKRVRAALMSLASLSSKNSDSFQTVKLNDYHSSEHLPGISQNSGCGLYIRNNFTYHHEDL